MRRADRGAAAVEFALVVPILIFLLFGIIDYGLYFTNALAVRAGVSDAGRQIIVSNFSGECEAFADSGSYGDLVDKVEDCIDPIGAEVIDAAVVYDNPWTVGRNVVVCAVVDVDGVTGITPMPQGGQVTARIVLPIQQAIPPTSFTPPGTSCD